MTASEEIDKRYWTSSVYRQKGRQPGELSKISFNDRFEADNQHKRKAGSCREPNFTTGRYRKAQLQGRMDGWERFLTY